MEGFGKDLEEVVVLELEFFILFGKSRDFSEFFRGWEELEFEVFWGVE